MFHLAINIGDPCDNTLIKVIQHNNIKQKAQRNNVLKWRTNSRQNNSKSAVEDNTYEPSRRMERGINQEGCPYESYI